MILKLCSICKEEIPLSGFHKKKDGKHGVRTSCKTCRKEESRQRYINNKDKIDYQSKVWAKNNVKRKRELQSKWSSNNRDKMNSKEARRRATKKQAYPKWLTEGHKSQIKKIYSKAKEYRDGGFDCHVDHIIPLQNDKVCGLHVPWNLQILGVKENIIKGNRF